MAIHSHVEYSKINAKSNNVHKNKEFSRHLHDLIPNTSKTTSHHKNTSIHLEVISAFTQEYGHNIQFNALLSTLI